MTDTEDLHGLLQPLMICLVAFVCFVAEAIAVRGEDFCQISNAEIDKPFGIGSRSPGGDFSTSSNVFRGKPLIRLGKKVRIDPDGVDGYFVGFYHAILYH